MLFSWHIQTFLCSLIILLQELTFMSPSVTHRAFITFLILIFHSCDNCPFLSNWLIDYHSQAQNRVIILSMYLTCFDLSTEKGLLNTLIFPLSIKSSIFFANTFFLTPQYGCVLDVDIVTQILPSIHLVYRTVWGLICLPIKNVQRKLSRSVLCFLRLSNEIASAWPPWFSSIWTCMFSNSW